MLVTIFLLIDVATGVLLICLQLLLVSIDVATSSDFQAFLLVLFAGVVLVALIGSFIPTIVFFLMWVHRVVRNMPALGVLDPRWSPAGAVVRSFIPFLSLVHPMSGTLEAWRGSDPRRRWTNVTERKAMGVPGLIIEWWSLWLIGNVVSNLGNRVSNSKDVATAAVGDWISIAGILMNIGAAILAVLVVRDVTARQDRKNELIATGHLA